MKVGGLNGNQSACFHICLMSIWGLLLTLLHSEWPKLPGVLAVLSAIGSKEGNYFSFNNGPHFGSALLSREKKHEDKYIVSL